MWEFKLSSFLFQIIDKFSRFIILKTTRSRRKVMETWKRRISFSKKEISKCDVSLIRKLSQMTTKISRLETAYLPKRAPTTNNYNNCIARRLPCSLRLGWKNRNFPRKERGTHVSRADNENDIDRVANSTLPPKIENFQARSRTKENGADIENMARSRARPRRTFHKRSFLASSDADADA